MNPAPPPASAPPAPHPYHDFAAKLRQPDTRPLVLDYLRWRRAARAAETAGRPAPPFPDIGPLSVNLDLTTACNYACDHCIDWESLNSPARHEEKLLRESMRELARRGLRSVILIGGGEPTVYPGFEDMLRYLKELRLQVAVVSNGGRNERIAAAADCLEEGDWVRLSLDAGSDATFQAMHRPKRPITLDQICTSAGAIKRRNPALTLGFSFVIVWRGARRDDVALVENVHEMALAAHRARAAGFDYISFKPCLARAADGAEVLDPHGLDSARLRAGLEAARAHQGGGFRVIESLNLRVLLDGSWRRYTDQPRECHMQALRQVLSPLGVYNCPAHRGVARARVGDPEAWARGGTAAAAGTQRLVREFDAHRECAQVTCLYNPVNRYLEELVSGGGDLEAALEQAGGLGDSFL
ncbi:MAG: radical SAM protein [Planctomycetota bacterium]|nr:MAG: radical SAM protein [Planctomycetota bacterium]